MFHGGSKFQRFSIQPSKVQSAFLVYTVSAYCYSVYRVFDLSHQQEVWVTFTAEIQFYLATMAGREIRLLTPYNSYQGVPCQPGFHAKHQ